MNELPIGWNGLDVIPPDEFVDVIDCDGNIATGEPTYYPFEIETLSEINKFKHVIGWRLKPKE